MVKGKFGKTSKSLKILWKWLQISFELRNYKGTGSKNFEKLLKTLYFKKKSYRNFWTLNASVGRWTLDAGFWTLHLDAGLWTFDSGCWSLDAGPWSLDVGSWTLDAGLWTLDSVETIGSDMAISRMPKEIFITRNRITLQAAILDSSEPAVHSHLFSKIYPENTGGI